MCEVCKEKFKTPTSVLQTNKTKNCNLADRLADLVLFAFKNKSTRLSVNAVFIGTMSTVHMDTKSRRYTLYIY